MHIRVLIFDPSNRNPGHSVHLIDALDKLCKVQVVMPYRKEEEDVPAGKVMQRLRVVPVVNRVNKGIFKILDYVRGWWYVIRHATDVDIIHIEWLSLLDRTGIELKLVQCLLSLNPNIVYTVHDVFPLYKNDDKRALERFQTFYQMLPVIRVHSHYAKKVLIESFHVNESRIYVNDLAPLLSDLNMINHMEKRENVGMIGTLSPYKGVLDSIKAFALIKDKFSGKLLLAGGLTNEYKKEIEKLINEYGISNRVILLGRYLTTKEVIELHRSVRVILLPYQSITQSGAALTSVSLGVPVVAYNVGGMSELIQHSKTGYLVTKGDIEGLAKSIMAIIGDNSVDYRTNCLNYAKTKPWENVAMQTFEVYEAMREKNRSIS